jgi:hypothetical protein
VDCSRRENVTTNTGLVEVIPPRNAGLPNRSVVRNTNVAGMPAVTAAPNLLSTKRFAMGAGRTTTMGHTPETDEAREPSIRMGSRYEPEVLTLK